MLNRRVVEDKGREDTIPSVIGAGEICLGRDNVYCGNLRSIVCRDSKLSLHSLLDRLQGHDVAECTKTDNPAGHDIGNHRCFAEILALIGVG